MTSSVLLAKLRRTKSTPPGWEEVQRILGLGVGRRLTRDELEAFCRDEVEAEHFERGFRYWPQQADAIMTYDEHGGVFGSLSVGAGKTLATLKIAERGFRKGLSKILLLVPASVFGQLRDRDIAWAREHVGFAVPTFWLGKKSAAERLKYARSQKRGLYVLPYSCLSTKDAREVLDGIEPELIVSDECFPPGTRVLTSEGNRAIEEIVLAGSGWVVSRASDGQMVQRRVLSVFRRPAPQKFVRITHEKGVLLCTSEHPVWVKGRGYVAARSVICGDLLSVAAEVQNNADLPAVQPNFRNGTERKEHSPVLFAELFGDAYQQSTGGQEPEKDRDYSRRQNLSSVRSRVSDSSIRDVAQVLRSVLCLQVARTEASALVGHENVQGRAARSIGDKEPGSFAQDEGEEPDAGSCRAGQDFGVQKGEDISLEGGKWENDAPSEVACTTYFFSDGMGHTNQAGSGAVSVFAPVLQGRPCVASAKDSSGSGRPDTSNQAVEVPGSSEDRDFRGSRVACVEVLERGSVAAALGRSGEDFFVYDLEVEGDHNFIADGVVVSNCHALRHRGAARTRRIMDLLNSDDPPEFAAFSGTITTKSIRDYWHLIKAALRSRTPLPLSSNLMTDWAIVLDSGARPSEGQKDLVRPLVSWAEEHFPKAKLPFGLSGIRKAYQLRLNSAPGVVAAADSRVKTSLCLVNLPALKLGEPPAEDEPDPLGRTKRDQAVFAAMAKLEGGRKLAELIDKAQFEWTTPNGDQLDHAIHAYKWLSELTTGFYNELEWPRPKALAQLRNVSRRTAGKLLKKARDHHEKLQEYHQALRKWFKEHRSTGLDTPKLVGQSMAQHGHARVGKDLYAAWTTAREADFDGRPERDSRAVRVCSYKVDHVVRWVQKLVRKKPVGCLVWVYHREVGRWVAEALKVAGVEPVFCPAGTDGDRRILEPENRDRVVVASMRAHGQGKNLQAFEHQVFMQTPRTCSLMEQVLGRTHRPRQLADVLEPVTCNTTTFDEQSFAACLNDALYVSLTTGSRQKIVYCDFSPLPRIFPGDVLRERIPHLRRLDKRGRKLLSERFGRQKS